MHLALAAYCTSSCLRAVPVENWACASKNFTGLHEVPIAN